MKTLLTLLTESSLALVLFYCIYWFVLRKETFFRLNRFYLIGSLVLSVVLPLFPLHYSVISGSTANPADLTTISAIPGKGETMADILSKSDTTDLYSWFVLITYLSGALFLLSRLLYQTAQLIFVLLRSGSIKLNDIYLVRNHHYNIPFSFVNHLFYNPDNHTQEDLSDIIVHEKVHIHERHWIDLLIAELWGVVFWFNPFVWLFERSIRQNHEYLADAGVLAQGHPVGRYQALIINQLMGSQVVGLANHLNFGLNANRFKMMTKKETPKIRVMRITWALPIVTLLLAAFAEPSYQQGSSASYASDQGVAITPSDKVKVTGTVTKADGSPLQGASVIIKSTSSGTVTGENGDFELWVPGNELVHLAISFVGMKTMVTEFNSNHVEAGLKITLQEETIGMDKIGAAPKDQPAPAAPQVPPPPAPAEKMKNTGEEMVFVIVEQLPVYPGGKKGLDKEVGEMISRMKASENLSGKAVVEFTVNEGGKPVYPKIVEQDNEAVGKAAISIVTNMKTWQPGKQRGKPVPVKYAMPLEF